MMKNNLLIILALTVAYGCSTEKSKLTGWNYNDPKHGGFENNTNFIEQQTPLGMTLVEGGTFTMGRVEQDVRFDWNNVPKTVTVSSFYMDETEVRNIDYLEYLFWLERVYGSNYDNGSYPEVFWKALPDTNVWRDKLSYNEPYVELYLRHPAYQDYPVVGVNWQQCVDFCAWRTDRVNERILIDNGYLWNDQEQVDENIFTTDAFLTGQYEGNTRRKLPNLKLGVHDFDKKAGKDKDATRIVNLKDGILSPRFRLPTEAEWEYAALALVGNTEAENISERKLYPWNGDGVRNAAKNNKGEIVANFKRGRGDNMGVAGKLNDNADKTNKVRTYWPNAFGLYNMAGNVSEWVMDVYRPLTDETSTDVNPFRGNVYETWQRDEDRFLVEKDSLGNIVKRKTTVEENVNRRNYSTADNINFNDGDNDTKLSTDDWLNDNSENPTNEVYQLNNTSLISDRTKVFKGGSWNDRAYWMVPGTRRFLDQEQSTKTIGFRCVVDRLGPPSSNAKQNRRSQVDWNKKKQ
jgi:formylglycine-generating enzyme